MHSVARDASIVLLLWCQINRGPFLVLCLYCERHGNFNVQGKHVKEFCDLFEEKPDQTHSPARAPAKSWISGNIFFLKWKSLKKDILKAIYLSL